MLFFPDPKKWSNINQIKSAVPLIKASELNLFYYKNKLELLLEEKM